MVCSELYHATPSHIFDWILSIFPASTRILATISHNLWLEFTSSWHFDRILVLLLIFSIEYWAPSHYCCFICKWFNFFFHWSVKFLSILISLCVVFIILIVLFKKKIWFSFPSDYCKVTIHLSCLILRAGTWSTIHLLLRSVYWI